jgi:hypothetical protein
MVPGNWWCMLLPAELTWPQQCRHGRGDMLVISLPSALTGGTPLQKVGDGRTHEDGANT